MECMADRFFDGHPFRILVVVGCYTPEAHLLKSRANFRAVQVTEALDALVRLRWPAPMRWPRFEIRAVVV